MGIRGTLTRALDRLRIRGRPIAECRSGHPLTEADVRLGMCPSLGCPTPILFPSKGRVPPDAPRTER